MVKCNSSLDLIRIQTVSSSCLIPGSQKKLMFPIAGTARPSSTESAQRASMSSLEFPLPSVICTHSPIFRM